MSQKRFEILHNIPAPYRIHLFNCLSDLLRKKGYTLHIHFFAPNNPDRPDSWRKSLDDANFSYRIWDGYSFQFRGGLLLRLNPGLVWHLMSSPPKILVHGGIWDSLTSLLALILARPEKRVGWLEFNEDIPGRSGPLSRGLKRWLLKRCECLLVPGQKSLSFLDRYIGPELKQRTVILPNIVSEMNFRSMIEPEIITRTRKFLKLDLAEANDIVLIWPARLNPEKGILEFIGHINRELLNGYSIRILGEGPLREKIEEKIFEKHLNCHVKLITEYLDYELMPAVYSIGNALLLPSLRDPNPLSVVEALHSGLPLLLSHKVGNFKEALVNKENGFGFDPYDGEEIRESLKRFKSLTAKERLRMGERSSQIASTLWDSRICIESAVAGILNENLP